MADAAYFHATLYKFDAQAQGEVVKRLNAGVDNVLVRCWYDETRDVFCLSCPTGDLGPFADGVLANVIAAYVDEELVLADREDRPPRVHRFPESNPDLLDATTDELSLPLSSLEEDSSSDSDKVTPARVLVRHRHFINVDPSEVKHIKFFKLGDLPKGPLERILTKEDQASWLIVHNGLIARTVQWDLKTQKYVLDRHIRRRITTATPSQRNFLESVQFPLFEIERGPAATSIDFELGKSGDAWFVKHGNPKVQRFLAGMDETVQVDPNEMAEMPADTKRLVAQTSYGMSSTIGRARVPKRRTASQSSGSAEESSDRGDTGAEDEVDFSSLLAANYGRQTSEIEVHPTPVPMMERSTPPSSTRARAQSVLDDNTNGTHTVKSLTPQPSIRGEMTQLSENTMPAYERKYATIDQIGLNTAASVQAEYELETRVRRSIKPKKPGVASKRLLQNPLMLSPAPTGALSTAMSVSTGMGLQEYRSLGANEQLRRNANTTEAGRPAWEKIMAPRMVKQGKLVDDTAPPSGPQTTLPPGFDFGQYKSGIPGQVHAGTTSQEITDDLMDFSDQEPDQIIERLAVLRLNDTNRHYTMRQRMPKNKKSKNKQVSKGLKPQAQLELPDPVGPTARKRKAGPSQGVTKAEGSVDAQAVSGRFQNAPSQPTSVYTAVAAYAEYLSANQKASNASVSTQTVPESLPVFSQQPQRAPGKVAAWIHGLFTQDNFEAGQILVSFGTCLVHHETNNNFLPNMGVTTDDKIEQKLLSEAEHIQNNFLSRLTASDADAEFLINLYPGEAKGGLMCDIHIKTISGASRTVRLDDDGKVGFKVFAKDHAATASVSFPKLAHDARYAMEVITHDDTLRQECWPLVSSLVSTEVSPTIRGSQTTSAYAIDGVTAMRRFEKPLARGMSLMVTEVQELIMRSLDPRTNNGLSFQALALDRHEMVKEGKLWFELEIISKDHSLEGLIFLEDVVDDIIARIENIGVLNEGPWTRVEQLKQEVAGSNKDWYTHSKW